MTNYLLKESAALLSFILLFPLFSKGQDSQNTKTQSSVTFCDIAEFSFSPDISDNGNNFTFNNICALKLSNSYSFGVGFGVEQGGNEFNNDYGIPLSVDIRFYPKSPSNSVRAYFAIRGGYIIGVKTDYDNLNPVFIGASIGMRVAINQDLALQFGVGYRFEHSQFTTSSPGGIVYDVKFNYSFIPISIAIEL